MSISYIKDKVLNEKTINEDELFNVLSNRRRRFVLDYISKKGGSATIGEISDTIVTWEKKGNFNEVSSDRKNVYTSLQQNHLPRMEEANVINYNKNIGQVELTDNAEDYTIYLEVVRTKDVPWSQYYLILSSLSIVLMSIVSLNLLPFNFLSNFSWGIFISVIFFVSSSVNFYLNKYRRIGSSDPSENKKN